MHNLNLIPEDILRRRRYNRCKFILRYVFVFILVLELCVIFYMNYKIALIDNEIVGLADNPRSTRRKCDVEERYKDRRQREQIYNNIMENRIIYSSIIKDIMVHSSEEVSISSVEIKDKKLLVLEGKAYEIKSIGELLDEMRGLEYVIKTTLRFAQIQGEREELPLYYSFELLVFLKEDENYGI